MYRLLILDSLEKKRQVAIFWRKVDSYFYGALIPVYRKFIFLAYTGLTMTINGGIFSWYFTNFSYFIFFFLPFLCWLLFFRAIIIL